MSDKTLEPDDFDLLLKRAMTSRPEPVTRLDFAAVAMQRASGDAALNMLTRVNRWNRLFTAIAAIAIISISVWIIHSRWTAGGFQTWSQTTTSTTTDSTSSTETDISTTATEWMLGGALMAVGAVVVVICQRTIGTSDDWLLWQTGIARG